MRKETTLLLNQTRSGEGPLPAPTFHSEKEKCYYKNRQISNVCNGAWKRNKLENIINENIISLFYTGKEEKISLLTYHLPSNHVWSKNGEYNFQWWSCNQWHYPSPAHCLFLFCTLTCVIRSLVGCCFQWGDKGCVVQGLHTFSYGFSPDVN